MDALASFLGSIAVDAPAPFYVVVVALLPCNRQQRLSYDDCLEIRGQIIRTVQCYASHSMTLSICYNFRDI